MSCPKHGPFTSAHTSLLLQKKDPSKINVFTEHHDDILIHIIEPTKTHNKTKTVGVNKRYAKISTLIMTHIL